MCRKLRSINLHGCDLAKIDDVIQVLAQTANQLEVLNVSYTKITDKSIQSLATYALSLMSLTAIECTLLSGSGLAQLAENCHSLYCLDLTRCTNLTDASLLAFVKGAKYGCSANLRELFLPCCFSITPEVVVNIAETFNILEELSLQHCHKLTSEAIATLTKLQGLNWLDVRGCPLVSQDVIKKMRENNHLSVYSSVIKYEDRDFL